MTTLNDDLREAAAMIASGLLPRHLSRPEQVLIVSRMGRELGIQPLAALRQIAVIDGKPTLGAELLAGLCLTRHPGATWAVDSSSTACTVTCSRPGSPPSVFRWTLDDAKTAGLAGKGPWAKYPRAMLRSRAVSEACRAIFPDVTSGVYTPEELGADVDEDGTPQLPPTPAPKQLPNGTTARAIHPYADEPSEVDAVLSRDLSGRVRDVLQTVLQLQTEWTAYEEGGELPDDWREQLASVAASLLPASPLIRELSEAATSHRIDPDSHASCGRDYRKARTIVERLTAAAQADAEAVAP
jgi:hypothetical protein